MLNGIKELKPTVEIDYNYFKGKSRRKKDEASKIFDAILMDHPELYYIGNYQVDGYNVWWTLIQNGYIYSNKFVVDILTKRLEHKIDELYNKGRDLETDYLKEEADICGLLIKARINRK